MNEFNFFIEIKYHQISVLCLWKDYFNTLFLNKEESVIKFYLLMIVLGEALSK
jgi:hypothetical protein